MQFVSHGLGGWIFLPICYSCYWLVFWKSSLQGEPFIEFQELVHLNFHMITVDSEPLATVVIHLPDTNLTRWSTTILTLFSCRPSDYPPNFQFVLQNVRWWNSLPQCSLESWIFITSVNVFNVKPLLHVEIFFWKVLLVCGSVAGVNCFLYIALEFWSRDLDFFNWFLPLKNCCVLSINIYSNKIFFVLSHITSFCVQEKMTGTTEFQMRAQ